MGGECGTHGREERCVWSFGNRDFGDNMEDLSIDGGQIKITFNEITEGINWSPLAHDRDSWRAVVNTAMSKDVFS